jgi:hypothetical protein
LASGRLQSPTFGENEIEYLAMRLKLNKRDMIRGFHTYLAENQFTEK